jgi:iron complex transport system substrate-binding protein
MSEENHFEAETTRRQFVVGSVAAGAALVLGGRLGAGADAAWAKSPQWTFVDDRHVTITRPSRPKRIVAYFDAAASLYGYGIVPVGIFGAGDPSADPQLKKLPLGKITTLGTVYGEIDVEKLLALKPDLLVSVWYPPPRTAPMFGFKDQAQQDTITARVPAAAINGHTVGTNAIRRFSRLAAALGVNLRSPKLRKAKADFDKASAALKAAAAKKPGLRFLAVSGNQQYMYVGKPVDNADISYYSRLGVNIVVPSGGPYWDVLSWEQAGKYSADAILYDARPFSMSLDDAKKIPTFASLPAVKAGQVAPWRLGAAFTYQAYTANMLELATYVNRFHRL